MSASPSELSAAARRFASARGWPELAARLAAFLVICGFATLHWAALFDPMPVRRMIAVALIATCCGAVLGLSGSLRRSIGLPLRLVLVVLMTAFAVMAIGIRLRLLLPAEWGTLQDRFDGGLSVVGSVTSWPYSGPNTWLRLTALSAAPLTATAAAVLGFWPLRDGRFRRWLRFSALALLLLLYGIAAAARPFGHTGLRGVVLLLAIAAWLWLPRLRGRDAVVAAIAVGAAGLIGAGLTVSLAATKPWVDYRNWNWTLHKERSIAFNWRPSYGPITWPRNGTTLLLIKSKKPHYWRAQTLDSFNGVGWVPIQGKDSQPRSQDIVDATKPAWNPKVQVTVRGLRSGLAIGPGTPEDTPQIQDKHSVLLATGVYFVDGELKHGDTYTIQGYSPDPTIKQMRAAPPPDGSLAPYTQLALPDRTGTVATSIIVPMRGVIGSGSSDARKVILNSVYAREYRLARSLTIGAKTEYDIVRQIGQHLESQYIYDEHPPVRRYPLDAFLYKDKAGYCQYFAGSAALLLRLVGIPARVVAGFAPGTYDKGTHEYVVKDTDAHQWLEVWFEGIGWVTFDPTPAVAPPSLQSVALAPKPGQISKAVLQARIRRPGFNAPEVSRGALGGAANKGGISWVAVALIAIVVVLLASATIGLVRHHRRARRPLPPPTGDPDVDQLVHVLSRLGLEVGGGLTLLALEERLQRLAGAEAAAYARHLRERRFSTNGDPAPERAERRHVRHVLAAAVGASPLVRLQLALPDSPVSGLSPLKLVRQQRKR